MTKHKAKRDETGGGKYAYRGYWLIDEGGSNSVRAAMERYSGRWTISKQTGPRYIDADHTVGREGTLRAAKQHVDRMIDETR